VPRSLDDIVHRCLARDPAQRFASAAAVSRALGHVGRSGEPRPGAAASPSAPPGGSSASLAGVPPAGARRAAAPRSGPIVRRRGRRPWLFAIVVLVVAVAAGIGAYVLVRDLADGSSGGAGSGARLPSAATATLTAASFDPEGTGTPGENDAQVPLAVDGDPTTAWSTEGYQSFSTVKDGVGLSFDLRKDHDLSAVTVDALDAGWSASIYASERPVTDLTQLDAWGAVRDRADVAGTSHTFQVGGVAARSVLVWFTALPTHDDGRQYLSVAEVRLG